MDEFALLAADASRGDDGSNQCDRGGSWERGTDQAKPQGHLPTVHVVEPSQKLSRAGQWSLGDASCIGSFGAAGRGALSLGRTVRLQNILFSIL
jgi:hypothetical protein